jgi:hypothetical protein
VTLGLVPDFGAFDSSSSWTFWQAEVDQYFELGDLPHVRQAVLALDAWTGGTPSWERRADGTVANRPPAYAGATLGGLWRMRLPLPAVQRPGRDLLRGRAARNP